MNTQIELRHLRYFVAVAEELHFGRAAKRLGMAQPPLSQQIRQLEILIGHPLFERTSRAVRLTATGDLLLDRARRTLRNVVEDIDEARRVGRGEVGSLRVGIIGSCMLTRVPSALGLYRDRYPRVELQLHEAFTARLIAGLLRGDLDAAFLRDGDPIDGIVLEPLLVEPFVVVVPRSHPCADRGAISTAVLRDDPFVLFPRTAGARAYTKTVSLCEVHGFRPRVVQEAPQWLTILRLVGAGLGVTIAPACVAQIADANVACLAIEGAAVASNIELASRRSDGRQIVREFTALVRRVLTPLAAPPAAVD
jgi:DNA-binding transcriptional LysR family regulator